MFLKIQCWERKRDRDVKYCPTAPACNYSFRTQELLASHLKQDFCWSNNQTKLEESKILKALGTPQCRNHQMMFRWAASASSIKSILVVQVWYTVQLHRIIVPDPPVRGRRRGFPPLPGKTLIEYYLIFPLRHMKECFGRRNLKDWMYVHVIFFFVISQQQLNTLLDWERMIETLLLKKPPKRKGTNLPQWKRG